MEVDPADLPRPSAGGCPLPSAAAAQGRPAARGEASARLQRLQTGPHLLRHRQRHLRHHFQSNSVRSRSIQGCRINKCWCFSSSSQNVPTSDVDSDWPAAVADYIRNNDEAVLRGTDQLLNSYQNDFLPSASFDEFCDVTGNLPLPSPSLSTPLHPLPLRTHKESLSSINFISTFSFI